ncbi:hypothetical protein [Caldivirga sp.]
MMGLNASAGFGFFISPTRRLTQETLNITPLIKDRGGGHTITA